MLLFDHVCDRCEKRFEVFKGSNDPDEVLCPECGEPTRQLLGGFAVRGAAGGPTGGCGGSGWAGG